MKTIQKSLALLFALTMLLSVCSKPKPIFEITAEYDTIIQYQLVAEPTPRYTMANFSPELFITEYNELLEKEGIEPMVPYQTIEREKTPPLIIPSQGNTAPCLKSLLAQRK